MSETRVVEWSTVKRFRKFRERVGWRLAELGIRQVDLARRLGVSRRRLVRILSAKAITTETWSRLTVALEWELADWDRPLPTDPAPRVRAKLMAESSLATRRILDTEKSGR